jgi:uncharacterized membrane protein
MCSLCQLVLEKSLLLTGKGLVPFFNAFFFLFFSFFLKKKKRKRKKKKKKRRSNQTKRKITHFSLSTEIN